MHWVVTIKYILQAISYRFAAEHVTSVPQLRVAAWDMGEVCLQRIKRMPIASPAHAAIRGVQDSINQDSSVRNL